MFRIGNFSMLVVLGGAFYAGRKSKGSGLDKYLDGLKEGIDEGYARALITLHIKGVISLDEVEDAMKEVVK